MYVFRNALLHTMVIVPIKCARNALVDVSRATVKKYAAHVLMVDYCL